MRTIVLFFAFCLFFGCSDDTSSVDTGPADTGPAPDGAVADGAVADGIVPDGAVADSPGGDVAVDPCLGCSASEGCLIAEVTRKADDSMQPWIVWPTEADGKGTLIVSARTTGASPTLVRKTVSNADFTPASASYEVKLDCIPAGDAEARAFLDDNENAQPDAYYSADYRDSCTGAPRKVDVTIVAGKTAHVTLELANSCD